METEDYTLMEKQRVQHGYHKHNDNLEQLYLTFPLSNSSVTSQVKRCYLYGNYTDRFEFATDREL